MIQESHSWAYNYPEKTIIQKDTFIPMYIATLFINNSQDMEAT